MLKVHPPEDSIKILDAFKDIWAASCAIWQAIFNLLEPVDRVRQGFKESSPLDRGCNATELLHQPAFYDLKGHPKYQDTRPTNFSLLCQAQVWDRENRLLTPTVGHQISLFLHKSMKQLKWIEETDNWQPEVGGECGSLMDSTRMRSLAAALGGHIDCHPCWGPCMTSEALRPQLPRIASWSPQLGKVRSWPQAIYVIC